MNSNVRAIRPGQDQAPRRAHLTIVERDAQHRRRRSAVVAFAALLMVFGTLFALAAFQARLVEGQARLDRLNSKMIEKQAYYKRLRLKVATLASPQHVMARAVAMGMQQPKELTFLRPTGELILQARAKGMPTGRPVIPIRTVGTAAWQQIKEPERAAP